jgi:hypothetical protein
MQREWGRYGIRKATKALQSALVAKSPIWEELYGQLSSKDPNYYHGVLIDKETFDLLDQHWLKEQGLYCSFEQRFVPAGFWLRKE